MEFRSAIGPLVLLVLLVAGCNCDDSISSDSVVDVCEVDTEMTCKNWTRGTSCGCVSNGSKAKCCHFKLNLISDYLSNCAFENLTALFFFNCSSESGTSVSKLDLTPILKTYTSLQTLAFTSADYNTMTIDPKTGNNTALKCLNVSNNNLENSTAVANVINLIPSLNLIDVSNNNLSLAPNISSRDNFWMYIANNKFLKCDGIDELMTKNISKFLHPGQTLCRKSVSIAEWMNNDVLHLNLSSIVSTNMINSQCPPQCECRKGRIVTDDQKQNSVSHITVEVNCSNRHLNKMPDKLPIHTAFLDISYNNISDLMPDARIDSNYKTLKSINADRNNIQSLQSLEGTEFLSNFNDLSLKGNRITVIPHFLEKALRKNSGTARIWLSENNFECSCDTALHMKPLLAELKNHIVDYDQIQCTNMQSQKITELLNESVCTMNEINYIYYIIVAEVLLLLLLVGKVSYDYWVFKHVGYLPWPASKMPRLPCDCVLEN